MNLLIAVFVSLAFVGSSQAKSADIRLAGSGVGDEGRLEVFHDGVWGTVCNHNFDDVDASIACANLLGYRYVGQVIGTQYGEGSGPIWMDEVNCAGTEASLDQCSHSGWGIHNCQHSDDVSISCTYMNASACPEELGFSYLPLQQLCYAADTTPMSWSGAALYCKSLHPAAHLIVIDDASEQTALINYGGVLPYCQSYWTAAQRLDNPYHDYSCNSEFAWTIVDFNTRPSANTSWISYTNWNSAEPTCSCTYQMTYEGVCESCMYMNADNSYEWYSAFCTQSNLCPFCEIDTV